MTLHVVLNRRLLLKYIHGLAACPPSLSREAIWAAVLVAITVVVAIGHPYVGK